MGYTLLVFYRFLNVAKQQPNSFKEKKDKTKRNFECKEQVVVRKKQVDTVHKY